MKVRLLEVAEAELDEAVRWYNAQAPGLGKAFLVEVLSAIERIMVYPDAWQHIEDGVRRCRLSRFPYGLIYAVEDGEILILAVGHLHRHPHYWRHRLTR